jgi:hypothetical protein
MKTLITTVAAGLLAVSFSVNANATTKSEARQHIAQREALAKSRRQRRSRPSTS